MTIWDHGDYEKGTDREVKYVLHGSRAAGRYALFATSGRNWMIHRMDPSPPGWTELPGSGSPMLAKAGDPPGGTAWAWEFKWDGIRALVSCDGGRARATSRNGSDLTPAFPEGLELAGESSATSPSFKDVRAAELAFAGWTARRRLRHPTWRGEQPDKTPGEVVYES